MPADFVFTHYVCLRSAADMGMCRSRRNGTAKTGGFDLSALQFIAKTELIEQNR